ncbi:MAG TPA: hypothetical protein VK530_14950 [Candidatus Acidoferrum sp.]|nr:hypothetical protein [Candidatus Acidoferrum sp.]
MKSLLRILIGVLLLGLAGLAYLNWRTSVQLGAENERLRAQLAANDAAAQPTASNDAELERLRAESAQLAKLRGEVMRLRAASNDLVKARQAEQQLRTEIQQLRAASASAAASTGTPANHQPVAAGYVTRDQFAFAGYGSAEASLNSMLWAMRQGQSEALLSALSPDMQAEMRKKWETENKSPEQVTAEMTVEGQRLQGMQVLQSAQQADGSVLLTVQMDQTRNDGTLKQNQQKMIFQQVGNEWKLSPKAPK